MFSHVHTERKRSTFMPIFEPVILHFYSHSLVYTWCSKRKYGESDGWSEGRGREIALAGFKVTFRWPN